MAKVLIVMAGLLLGVLPVRAQFLGAGPQADFHNTSMLKPPAGQKVALVVFEDLGCPGCAAAHPYEMKAIEQTHVAFLRHDFPLAAHVWTFQGAVCARYLQDKVSPGLATQYRTYVFASQRQIASKDDLQQFTQTWFQRHGQQMPFVLDPTGALAKEVQADFDLGMRLNVRYTPTVVVVTQDRYQVVCGTKDGMNDPARIAPVLEAAIAQTKAEAAHARR